MLQDAGLATLLIDLLEEDETQDRRNVFDIELLAERLEAATLWLSHDPDTRGHQVGLLRRQHRRRGGPCGRGSAAGTVAAVVSRGGRPDLAWGDFAGMSSLPRC